MKPVVVQVPLGKGQDTVPSPLVVAPLQVTVTGTAAVPKLLVARTLNVKELAALVERVI